MLLLETLLGAAAIALLAPVLILSAEVLAALFTKEDGPLPEATRPRLAVIIPAHDEESGIPDTLRALIPQLRAGDRLVVVADNCIDDTAAIASAEGAEVIVRNDQSLRGKGYALDFGMRHLERDPPGAVLILDADCHVTEGTVERLALLCAQSGRPVQALNLSHAPPGAGVKVRIAEFASALKNLVRPLGLRGLGLPCQLTGTGMVFPWNCISTARLATGHIVEDLKLGLELAAAGHPPLFCPEARVTSYFPASEEGFRTQRTRWEHGYLGVLLRDAPGVLMRSLRTLNGQLLAMGLDLCVPPIALLSLLVAAVWVASGALYVFSQAALPLVIASTTAGLLALSVLASWARYGRQIVSLGTLALAVAYALWKAPVYGRFLVARQLHWVRSKRD
jgi:cellulose synthase/poly-beta-1,6-N-acetylglucosamine synthase-like glycosyltransferase